MGIIEENHDFELSSRVWDTNNVQKFSHWHKNVEVLQILENNCRILINGCTYDANEGDIVVIKEQDIHRNFFKEDGIAFRALHFDNKIIHKFNSPIAGIQSHITAEEIKNIPQLGKTLDMMFELADKEGETAVTEDNPFFESLVASVYFLLLRHFPAKEQEAKKNDENEEFYKIVDYINRHYKEDINVQTISKALYCSRSRMTRLFTKYTGASISEYITQLRIKKANLFLASGHSVTETAMESGFSSVRTFNSVYKTYMGITPTEYKRIHKKTVQ